MTTPAASRTSPLAGADREARPARSGGDETKPSWKSTELLVYLAAVIAVLIASQLVGGGAHNGNDYFVADKAWWYITLLTIGYLVSRGLAKWAAAPGIPISAPIPVPTDLPSGQPGQRGRR